MCSFIHISKLELSIITVSEIEKFLKSILANISVFTVLNYTWIWTELEIFLSTVALAGFRKFQFYMAVFLKMM